MKPPTETFVERLGKAMQAVWNDHCADTGEVPVCFQMSNPRTTLTAEFLGSGFVYEIAKVMHANALNRPPFPELEGCFPVVLYMANEADREELINVVKQCHPGMVARNL